MGDDLYRQRGGVGGEAPRRLAVESHAVPEVSYGISELGLSAVVGLQLESVAPSACDGGTVVLVDDQHQMGAESGPDPADDQTSQIGVRLAPKVYARARGHVGYTVHPVGNGVPVGLGHVSSMRSHRLRC